MWTTATSEIRSNYSKVITRAGQNCTWHKKESYINDTHPSVAPRRGGEEKLSPATHNSFSTAFRFTGQEVHDFSQNHQSEMSQNIITVPPNLIRNIGFYHAKYLTLDLFSYPAAQFHDFF